MQADSFNKSQKKSLYFKALKLEKEKMKHHCLKKCLDLDKMEMGEDEKNCLGNCGEKILTYLNYSNQLFNDRFFM